jgi:antitoxin component YwqK of YwqJK toxin-antitoxin module
MKPIFYSVLFFLIPKLVISQVTSNIKTIYLDSLWQKTSQENHKYYRVIKGYYSKNPDIYQVSDYYKSGVLEKEGLSKTKEGDSKTGEFIFYYENGIKKSVSNYVSNRLNGKETKWYENGILKEEGEYIVDEKKKTSVYKVNQFWSSNSKQKVIDGNGEYEETGEMFFASGQVRNGFKDGLWEGYDRKTGYTFSENYKNQKLVSGVSIDSEKVAHNYTVIKKKPEPKNGLEKFYAYVGRNFKYNVPTGINGKVITSFIVDEEGKLVEPKTIKSFGYGTDQEAIRVIINSEKWNPGEIRGIKVRCQYTLPITIQSPTNM